MGHLQSKNKDKKKRVANLVTRFSTRKGQRAQATIIGATKVEGESGGLSGREGPATNQHLFV